MDEIDHHPSVAGQVTRDNRIANNTITKAAQEFIDAAAIFAGYTTRTTIIHNSLSNLPYTGIAIGWGWGMTDPGRFPGCTGCPFESWKTYTTPTTSRGNKILYNKISDYLKVAYDGGGIYSLGQQGTSLQDGELIAGNVVFGKAPSHGGNALYTDGGSRYITLRGNAAFRQPSRPGRSRRPALRARLGRLPALRRYLLGRQLVAVPGPDLRLLSALPAGQRLPPGQHRDREPRRGPPCRPGSRGRSLTARTPGYRLGIAMTPASPGREPPSLLVHLFVDCVDTLHQTRPRHRRRWRGVLARLCR